MRVVLLLSISILVVLGLTRSEDARYAALIDRGIAAETLRTLPAERVEALLQRVERPRPGHPDAWQRWRRRFHQDARGDVPADAWTRADRTYRNLGATEGAIAGVDRRLWQPLGPGNIGGRVRAMAFHPSNRELWIGSVSGGLWKRTFNGAPSQWRRVADFMGNLAITSIVFDPTDSQTMYASTGEGFGNGDGVRGAGIFKSTNGGKRWSQLPSTANANFYWVNRLAIAPNGGALLAATGGSLYRSVNGGTSWVAVRGSNNSSFLDVKFHPTNSNVAVAHYRDYDFGQQTWFSTGLYSTNGGVAWNESSNLRANDWLARIEFAFHAGWTGAGNGAVYAMQAQTGRLSRSTNGGASFQLVSSPNVGTWYNNTLWIDPTDTDAVSTNDLVVIGGVDLHRSTDGGQSFTQISEWFRWPTSAHADHHMILEAPGFDGVANRTVYFANDGGIWRNDVYSASTQNGWQDLNHDLPITQFYGASASSQGIVIGGTQDAGTLRYTPANGVNGWTTMFGGDGGFCASDPSDSSIHYGEYIYGAVHRSTDGGASADYICGQYWTGFSWAWKNAPYRIDDAMNQTANFIAPMVMDPSNSQRLLVGGQRLWRTNDARTTNTSTTGPRWAVVKSAISSRSNISAIAIDPTDSSRVWVGYNDGTLWRTTDATATSPTWSQLTGIAVSGRILSRILIDPNDTDRMFVTFGGFVANNLWRSTDGGTSWSAVSSVPQVPLRDIEVASTNASWLYLATEVGVLVSDDDGASWAAATQGPARVAVDDLFWSNGELHAVTHGRGIFKVRPTLFSIALATTGAGDLTITLQNLQNGAVTGFTFFSLDTSGPVGRGRFFGLYPDSLTVSTLTTPFPLFQWSSPYLSGTWPKAPFSFPPGLFSILSGLSMDATAVAFDPAFKVTDESDVSRVTF